MSKDNVSKPSAGIAKIHSGIDNVSAPASAGVTPHPEKAAYDQKHGRSGLNKPNAGARDRGKDSKTVSKPEGGDAAIPKKHLHLDKHAYEKARKHESKPAKGRKYADGSTTTKC